MRKTTLLCDKWQFACLPLGYKGLPERYHDIELPHDWLIGDSRALYRDSVGVYRRFIYYTPAEDKRLFIRFDGVYMNCTVTVNSHEAGLWRYGYTTFELELTELMREGENELIVRIEYKAPNSRWYSGAGIYRNVHLIETSSSRIASDGVYISTRVSGAVAEVAVSVETDGGDNLRHSVYSPSGELLAMAEGGSEQTLTIDSPLLWSPESPMLYLLKTELLREGEAEGEAIDEVCEYFGIRTIELDSQRGFILNGNVLKLRGVCLHHDLGALGAAFSEKAAERQLGIMKEMGANAVRTAHNPPAPEFMSLCDRMGLMVVSECFDVWEHPKNEFDYARFFPESHEKDVASWIRRDRNHASLIMWSIGNEISDTHSGSRGYELTAELASLVRRHDPRCNAFTTIGSNYMPWENAQRCSTLLDAAGYNYAEREYHVQHSAHPSRVIYGSETSSMLSSRGIYHFPLSQSILTDDDLQCSALGNSCSSWGAKSYESFLIDDRDAPFSLGQFIWSGFDYIGEPTPYHTKNSYFGLTDTAGFPKDAYYIVKAEWTSPENKPFVHLFPYWDFTPGQLIDIRAASNAPQVELFVNGESLGRQVLEHENGRHLLGDWQAPYSPGKIEAIAYDTSGRELARDCALTFGDAASISLKPSSSTLKADGRDLCFIEISTLDSSGREVENSVSRAHVTVSGCGRLVGLDNGDSTDYDSYKAASRRLFSGKLLAIVQSTLEAGDITVSVSSPLLTPASLVITAEECERISGISAVPCCIPAQADNGEIPVRKLELIPHGGMSFTAEQPELEFSCRILPPEASDRDLIWRLTNDAGIDSCLARIEGEGEHITVRAMGDGAFRLRCLSRSGTDTIRTYAQLELTASGIGSAYLDPYSFVSGGLYSRSFGLIGSGNERGFASSRTEESAVCFDDLDFGAFGSETISISFFVLDSDPFEFELWEGLPRAAGSKPLGTFVYQKPTIWNTYQAETFRLERRLSGVTSLGFLFNRKAHVKGFSFTRESKGYSLLYAAECDSVTGDSFTQGERAVTDIGNNVSLVYTGMELTQGASGIAITGSTPLDSCTLQLRLTDRSGESRLTALEFACAGEFTERRFSIDAPPGEYTASFVFLPGSNFSFESFCFLK